MPRFKILAVGSVMACAAGPLVAQTRADSAAAARTAYRQAVTQFRRGDSAQAHASMRRAYEAWPTQPAYLIGLASVAARVGDTAEAVHILTRLADLGLTHLVDRDPDFDSVRASPAFERVAARLRANAEPKPRSRVFRTVEETDLFPEGISHDPVTGSIFLSSVRHRKVIRIDSTGAVSDFLAPGQDSLWSVLGVRVDAPRRLLWLSTVETPYMDGAPPNANPRTGLAAFELGTKRLVWRWLLPADSGAHFFGDLLVSSTGDVYTTDSSSPLLIRVHRTGAGYVADTVAISPLFHSLQGLALSPDERTLYLSDYSLGILAVDLAHRTVKPLASDPGVSVLGVDGMVRYGSALIGIQNGAAPLRVIRMDLSADGTRITAVRELDRHLPLADQPTIGTLWGDRFLYVANSLWDWYDDGGTLKPGAILPRPTVLELELGKP